MDLTRNPVISRPTTGELSGAQGVGIFGAATPLLAGSNTLTLTPGRQVRNYVGTAVASLPGYGPAPAGTYATYELISGHPTASFVIAAAHAAILSAGWSTEADERATPEMTKAVADAFNPHRTTLLGELLRATEFGKRAIEMVWQEAGGYLTIDKFKSLNPDDAFTTIEVSPDTGCYAGLRQGRIFIPAVNTLLYSYGKRHEHDYHGRSRHENIRELAWWPWLQTLESGNRLDQKISGIIPIVHYPSGDGEDANGSPVSNYSLSLGVIANIGRGRGVSLPNLTGAADDPRAAAELAKKSLWDVDFYDAGNIATAQSGIIEKLRYLDSLIVRGWLMPERAIIEGQFGTKAEAESHGDVAIQIAELLYGNIVACINRHAVRRFLALNFGEQCRDWVRLVPTALADDQKAFFRQLYNNLLANPSVGDLVIAMTDTDAVMDEAGVPKAKADATLVRPSGTPAAPADPAAPPAGVTDPMGAAAQTTPAAADQEVQTTAEAALNGAQMASAADIVRSVNAGEIPRDSGIGLLMAGLNVTREKAEEIMASAGTAKAMTAAADALSSTLGS